VLEPPDVRVLTSLFSIGRDSRWTSPIASSVSRSAASRGSTSIENSEVRHASIWTIVFDFST